MAKIALIECPHCGQTIKIRKIEAVDLPAERTVPFWKAMDDILLDLFGRHFPRRNKTKDREL